jgi:hypothetical protein
VPAEALTIQEGLDAAEPGDTVLLAPGTYTGTGNWNLDFRGKDLVLTSEGGAAQTILRGTAPETQWIRGLTMDSGETRAAVVEGLTFQDFYHQTEGSGVFVAGASAPTIRDCVFLYNQLHRTPPYSANNGMSVQVRGSGAPLFLRCRIAENGPSDWGTFAAAVSVEGHGLLRMEDCVVTRNVGNECSGVWVSANGRAELIRCEVSANTPYGIDAGYDEYDTATLLLEDCLIIQNISPHGGGVRVRDGILRGCTIVANDAPPGGGGLAVVAGGDVLAERCIFYGNCASEGSQILTWGRLRLSCCLVPESGISTMWGNGSVEWIGPPLDADPRLCNLPPCPQTWPPPLDGDFHLRSDSPCLPQFSPCGQQIGAFGEGCVAPAPVGACCVDTVCRLRTQAECASEQGIYQGNGESCYPDPCPSIPVEPTTWGRIKAKFR